MNKKNIIKELSKFYKIKTYFRKNWNDHASVNLLNDKIYIHFYSQIDLEFLLSCFFHELAHIICKHNNKYPLFHSDISKLRKKDQLSFLKTIWRAETFVDQLGKKTMKSHFPDLKYHVGYNKKTKKALYKELINSYRVFFKDINNYKQLY